MSTQQEQGQTGESAEERTAMEQLRAANPADAGNLDSKAGAMYQRITRGAGGSATPVWRRWPAVAAGLAVVAVVAVASFAMMSGGGNGGGDGLPVDPGVDEPGGSLASCIGYSEDELRLREFAFRGTATEVTDTTATFGVSEWFAGNRGDSVTLELDSSLLSEMYNDFTFAEGEEYLVSGDAGFAWGCGFTRPFDGDLATAWDAVLAGGTSAVGESQAVGSDGMASCAFMYGPETLAQRDHAFDGVIVAIEGGTGPGGISYPSITFEVTEWFKGAGTETIQLLGSALAYGYNPEAEAPSLEVGGRYLVSGDAEFAWGCGFSRTYSEEEAEAWRTAFAD